MDVAISRLTRKCAHPFCLSFRQKLSDVALQVAENRGSGQVCVPASVGRFSERVRSSCPVLPAHSANFVSARCVP